MFTLPTLTVVSLSLLLSSPIVVSSQPTSPLALAVVVQEFSNAHIVPDVIPTFTPGGTLQFNFSTTANLKTGTGDALNATTTKTDTAPIIYIQGSAASEATAGGPYNTTDHKYTIILFDAGVPGNKNSSGGYNLHWLANDYTYGENDDHTVTLKPPTDASTTPVTYHAPAPPSGSGPHRYIGLTFVQPSDFTPPASSPAPGGSVKIFNVEQYLSDAKLGDPIAGTYFTQETGSKDASVSVEATTSVDSTTLPQFTATSTGKGTGSSTSGTASATGGAKSGGLSSFGTTTGLGGLVVAVVGGMIGGGWVVM